MVSQQFLIGRWTNFTSLTTFDQPLLVQFLGNRTQASRSLRVFTDFVFQKTSSVKSRTDMIVVA